MAQRATPHEREQFIFTLLKQVPAATRAHALRLLRWGATYGRLAEAQCNGDYPADNGERDVAPCSECGAGYVLSACKVFYTSSDAHKPYVRCPSCRAERIIRETCESMGGMNGALQNAGYYGLNCADWVKPDFQGDPRGHTVRLQIAGAPLDAYERPALAVPTS